MRTISRDRLTPDEQELLQKAEAAARTATANYSDYHVGAAVLCETADGRRVVVTGNNYETLTYKSVCAEKHAVMKAYAELSEVGEGEEGVARPEVKAVAVFCREGGTPQQPCGDCRQTLFEVNPDMRVIAAAGPSGQTHDPRVTITTVRELLPHGFELMRPGKAAAPGVLNEPSEVDAHVVHFPKPADLERDAEARRALLEDVRFLLLVGSPSRARQVAEYASATLGLDAGCYCDLTVPGRNETVREFCVYTTEVRPGGPRAAIVSHGIGEAGVEIVLSEVPALLELATGRKPEIAGVIRAGTRGTLCRVPLGCIGLSTSTFDDNLDAVAPDPRVLDALREAATARGMTVLPEEAIDARGEGDWPEPPEDLLIEGAGLATRFFWRGQARPVYRAKPGDPGGADHLNRLGLLQRWTRKKIRWIEMEDYAVLEMAAACDYPAATLGAVIAHRRTEEGAFQVDYDKAMYKKTQMIPAEIALAAFGVLLESERT